MNIKKTVNSNKMEIELEGKFDAVSAPKFEAEISEELSGITAVDIDMSQVEYISSAGLRTLLFIQQTLDEVQGRLTVKNVPEIVACVFEATGFGDFITVE